MNMGIVAGLIKALAPGVDPQVIEQAVTDWLNDHPEATTTVQDGSITEAKLAQDVLADLGEIEELKEAIVPLTPSATSGDVGKFLKAKTVSGGKVTEYEFGSAGGGGSATVDDELSNSSTNPVQNKVITGALNDLEEEVGTVETTDIPFSFDNKYINDSGVESSATGYAATDYFDVSDSDAIAYTGKMGSSYTVFWYDSSKDFISADLKPAEKMIWYYNILTLKPDDAKYVRLVSKKTTASNPPPVSPVATAYKGKKYIDYLLKDIVGDGETDDTLAVQKVVNMANSVTFPASKNILLSASISIALGYASVIDGNGTTLIMDGDYYALTVEGTLNSSAAPSTIEDYVLKSEGGAVIKNFKITNAEPDEGGGMDVAKAFNLKLEDNYIYKCANGIRFSGMNRDINISGNHIYAITEDAILFDSGVNLHQCNIFGNMLMFAMNCINIDDPSAIANFQITGNDIELVNYPATGYANAKCIRFSCSSAPDMFGEIEICGNTIQSHDTSNHLIYMSGYANEPISDVSITGNNLSNSQDSAIYLSNCLNVAITGNNYASIMHYVYDLYGACTNILICGETARQINVGTVADGGKIHADSSATLTNVRCKNVLCTPNDDADIETSNVTNVDVEDEASANGVSF